MKSESKIRFLKQRRLIVGLVALLAAMAGGGCAWNTFVAWWEPVLWGVGLGVASGLMLRRAFGRLLALSGRLSSTLCAVVTMSALSYGAIMTVNYFGADDSRAVTVDAIVKTKFSEERTRYRRAGRGHTIPAGKYNVYYLRLEFPDGSTRDLNVNASTYVNTRRGAKKQFEVSDGFLGYKVFRAKNRELSK